MQNPGIIQLNRRTAEAVTAVVLLAAVIGLFVNSLSLPPSPMRGYPGPAFVPQLILIYTGVFISLWLVRIYLAHRAVVREPLVRAPVDAEAPADDGRFDFEYRDYAITVLAVVAFSLGLDYLGLEITCTVILAALLYPRLDSPAMAVFAATVSMLTVYVVFVLTLGVSIPLAFLPNYISF